jgi:hypothetical protein
MDSTLQAKLDNFEVMYPTYQTHLTCPSLPRQRIPSTCLRLPLLAETLPLLPSKPSKHDLVHTIRVTFSIGHFEVGIQLGKLAQ